jgi:uncharacterized protein RhaS with RHS repeats
MVPVIGRFISEDPLRWLAGPDLYAYVHGDPVRFIDPFGLDAITNDPNVRRCLCKLWKDAAYGHDSRERAAWVTQNSDGIRECVRWPWAAKFRSEVWKGPMPTGSIAIFHTHPNGADPKPSSGDRQAAETAGVPNYACSRNGISKIDPNCTNAGPNPKRCPVESVEDTNWRSWCK